MKPQRGSHYQFVELYTSESIRVLGFEDSVFNRAYGKPAVKEEKETVDLPPVVIEVVGQSAD